MKLSFTFFIFFVTLFLFPDHCLAENVHYASQNGGKIKYEKKTYQTEAFEKVLKKLNPGETAVLLPGTYTDSFKIKRSGASDSPILIKGINNHVIIDGQTEPTKKRDLLFKNRKCTVD